MTGESCDEMNLLIQAELDGELDVASAAPLAAHLETCAACSRLYGEMTALSSVLRRDLTRHPAPASFRRSIVAKLPTARRRWTSWQHGVSFGLGMAVAASIAVFVWIPGQGDPASDIVAAHIRALQPGHLVDVASTDQHTVKPWFDGRLDFAPPVRDLASQGFPLIGGRLDYLAGRPVAALVYGRDRHLIDVFVWPGDKTGAAETLQGYNVIGWSQGHMNFRAVSDLNVKELGDLVRLLQTVP